MCQVPFWFYSHFIDEKLRPEENKSVVQGHVSSECESQNLPQSLPAFTVSSTIPIAGVGLGWDWRGFTDLNC